VSGLKLQTKPRASASYMSGAAVRGIDFFVFPFMTICKGSASPLAETATTAVHACFSSLPMIDTCFEPDSAKVELPILCTTTCVWSKLIRKAACVIFFVQVV
jgi:hypothetical protein